jgi:hypothetical protein
LLGGNDYLQETKYVTSHSTVWKNYIKEKKNGNFLLKSSVNDKTKKSTWELNLEFLTELFTDDKSEEYDPKSVKNFTESIFWNINTYSNSLCHDYEYLKPNNFVTMGQLKEMTKKNKKNKISNILESSEVTFKDHPFQQHVYSMCVVPKSCHKDFFSVHVNRLVNGRLMKLLEKSHSGKLKVEKISENSIELKEKFPAKPTLSISWDDPFWIGPKQNLKVDAVEEVDIVKKEKRKRKEENKKSKKKKIDEE